MSVTNQTGATLTPSGGTPVVFTLVERRGTTNILACMADPANLRKKIFSQRSEGKESANKPGGYTLSRNQIVQHVPVTLADGSVSIEKYTLIVERPPERTSAQIAANLNDFAYLATSVTEVNAALTGNGQVE